MTSRNFKTLEAGRTYLNRRGDRVEVALNDDPIFTFKSDRPWGTYTHLGNIWNSGASHPHDLIALIEDEPAQKFEHFDELEDGRTYRSRDGLLYVVTDDRDGTAYPFSGRDPDGRRDLHVFTREGKYFECEANDHRDLIEVLVEESEADEPPAPKLRFCYNEGRLCIEIAVGDDKISLSDPDEIADLGSFLLTTAPVLEHMND